MKCDKYYAGYVLADVPTTERMGNGMSKLKLWVVNMCVWYDDVRMAPEESVMLQIHSCMITITKPDSWQNEWDTDRVRSDSQSGNHGVIAKIPKLNMNWGTDHTELTCSPQWEETALPVNSPKHLPAKKTLKYYCIFMIPISIINIWKCC